MIKFYIFILLISTTLALNERCEFSVNAAKQSSKAVSELSLKLYQKIIAAKPNDNIVFSPASISLGLALLESACAGDTKTEIQRFLSPTGSNQADPSTLYQSLQRQIQIQGEKEKLNIANALFYADNFTPKTDYVNKVKQCFNTEIKQAPFRSNPEEARQQINRFVGNVTAQKIPELFKPGKIDPSTLAVLANAIYLKAPWQKPFEKSENMAFYKFGRSNEQQTVSFMHHEDRHYYKSDNKMSLVEIPYTSAALSMYILLPKQRDGIGQLETTLTADKLQKLSQNLEYRIVDLKLPKFTVRSEVGLKDVLQQLGINKVFSDQADLSRFTDGRVKIGNALHEAYIKVNENGTEAAAATGLDIIPVMMPQRAQFIADHPFIFAIVHKPTTAIVFLGKVNFVE